uniref:FXYD domain-containing ion transport regulator n=1 Tax=Acanthochromis polyacanthus TaxID=80966 RepID=A0A3Q1EUZ5_9TELE
LKSLPSPLGSRPAVDRNSFFIPDYESLRIGGLVFAVVLFLLGIALIVSNGSPETKPADK